MHYFSIGYFVSNLSRSTSLKFDKASFIIEPRMRQKHEHISLCLSVEKQNYHLKFKA